MIKFISVLMTLVLFSCTPVHAKIYARQATSNYDADIKYKLVDYGGIKWYIGKCLGDNVMRSDRLAIRQVTYGDGDVLKVTIVSSKSRADMVICLR